MRNLFEELFEILQSSAENNVVTINNLELFIESWRKEISATKYGWVNVSDGDNDYLIPPEKKNDFDKLFGDILLAGSYMENPDAFDIFNDIFEQYRC